jgi:hypothetical protein
MSKRKFESEGPGRPLARKTFVRFMSVTQRTAAAARDTIIRNAAAPQDTFVVHVPLPDSCLQPKPPPPCPDLPLLEAARTDTIIR